MNGVACTAEKMIYAIPEVSKVFTTVGKSSSGWSDDNSPSHAEINVTLVSAKDRKRSAQEVSEEINRLVKGLPGMQVNTSPIGLFGTGDSYRLGMIVKGVDREKVQAAAEQIKAVMKKVEGTGEVKVSTSEAQPVIDVRIDRKRMSELGLSLDGVGTQLSVALTGYEDLKLRNGETEYAMRIIADKAERSSTSNIGRMRFLTARGQEAELAQFSEITPTFGPTMLQREDRLPAVIVTSQAVGRPSGDIAADIQAKLKKVTFDDGIFIREVGDSEMQGEAFASLGLAIIAAIVFVYLVMVALYNSFVYPVHRPLFDTCRGRRRYRRACAHREDSQHIFDPRHDHADRARRQERHPPRRPREPKPPGGHGDTPRPHRGGQDETETHRHDDLRDDLRHVPHRSRGRGRRRGVQVEPRHGSHRGAHQLALPHASSRPGGVLDIRRNQRPSRKDGRRPRGEELNVTKPVHRNRWAAKSALLFAACLFSLPLDLGAQGEAPTALSLTLEDTVDLALRNNLGLKVDRMKLDEKKGDLAANWNVFLPRISLSTAVSRSNLSDSDRAPDLSKFPEYAAAGFTGPFPTVPRWGAQLLLDLSWGLSTTQFLSMKQTSLDYNRGLISTQIAEKRLGREVKKLFYSLLLFRESVQIFEQSFDLAQRRLDLARARESIGSASELDVLAQEVNLESIRPQIIEQRDSYEIALANLKRLLGVKQEVQVSLDGGLDVPTEGSGEAQNLLQRMRGRLDLSYLRSVIDSLRNKLALDRSGLTPSLFVKWTVDPTFQRDLMDPSTWSGGSITDLWKQSQGALVIGVSIPLDPLLPSSRERRDIERSKLQIAEAEIGYQSALEGAEIEVLTLLKELDKSMKLVAAAEKNITLAEKLYEAAEKAYGSGARNYLELQDAMNKLNVARFERLRDKYGYLNALTELDFALTVGDLASN